MSLLQKLFPSSWLGSPFASPSTSTSSDSSSTNLFGFVQALLPSAIMVFQDQYDLGLTALVTVGMQLFFYAIAATFKFDKVTDLAGGMNFAVLALMTLLKNESYTTRALVLSLISIVTRVELALFLLYRVLKRKKDARFDKMRDNPIAFLVFWVFQMFWVWIVSLPIVLVNGVSANSVLTPALTAVDYAGWAMAIVGFFFQLWADFVKNSFRANPDNAGKHCDKGPWGFIRHPNYFGEFLLWWGIFMSASQAIDGSSLPVVSALPQWGWMMVMSPLFTMILLLFLSGIPTAEGANQARYMKSEDTKESYLKYRARTSPVLPIPPPLYAVLPMWVKRVFCFEFSFYEYREDKVTLTGEM
eukprot:m.353650 g.353650  ORF g.353650 m.353650 type:complete len:358 (-) comp16813_c0_seq1:323-1396(-)